MSTLSLDYRSPRTLVVTAIFIAIVVGVGALIGVSNTPDGWYEALQKPPFNPPNWIFGPVWFALYVMIGIAGARAFLRDARSPVFVIWCAQMLLNWAWSPTWFTLHQLWPALAIINAINALIIAFIVLNWREDRVAAVLFLPYTAWVSFATLLNLSIALLN